MVFSSFFSQNNHQSSSSQPDTVNLSSQKILLVEDEILLAELIQEALKRQNINVDITADGREVMDMVTKTAYDLILLDLGLPGKDGLDVLSELRSDERYRHTPIIILTNYADLDRIRRGRELGADDYLIKSQIDYTKIKEVLQHSLKRTLV